MALQFIVLPSIRGALKANWVLMLAAIVLTTSAPAAESAPKFAKQKIFFNNKSALTVELAKTELEQTYGLMFRKKLPEGEGMLFIYKDEMPRSFWMKNTFIPLSIGFFNKRRELIDVQHMAPLKSEIQLDIPIYKSKGSAMYALEANPDWFSKKKIKIGDTFSFK